MQKQDQSLIKMLEDKLQQTSTKPKNTKPAGVYDFLTAAYSSNKAVKVGLAASTVSPLPVAMAMALGVYLIARTATVAVKSLAKTLFFRYENFEEVKNDISSGYTPFGKYTRPTTVGAALSGITYLTGF